MANCLILRLRAPMLSFGQSVKGNRSQTDVFPSRSMLTGLLGNALGLESPTDDEKLNRLQDRLLIAARLNQPLQPGSELVDYQSANLNSEDRTWTIQGEPLVRNSAAATLEGSHIRLRHYLTDADLSVAVRLLPSDEEPNAEQIAAALEFPARVVYLGRKNCLPSGYLLDRQVESENALRALLEHPLPQEVGEDQTIRVRWDRREKLPSDLEGLAVRTLNTPGRVDFRTHLESGWLWWNEAAISVSAWLTKDPAEISAGEKQ